MTAAVCDRDFEKVKDILKIRLSKKRYAHSLNVADAAVRLAKKYAADTDAACLAGLVHDICKEIPDGEQLKMARECRQGISAEEENIPALYHAAAGSWYCENVLHIDDPDILNAVRYHTTGRADMSLTEEIIYLADLISEDRSYKDAARMRKLAFESVDGAMLEALRFSVKDIASKGSLIPENTWAAYNLYVRRMQGRITGKSAKKE
ncbi:MAG: bis(5'-nucleosyl)-tetraphosphatase (symmetrical) YqeK [Ruminococcus sp.]|nr:bis(5'-nucleosyl)-tetraphosphatase (symmetrical) YqeK [Ruminococcus sp.]